MPLTFETEVMFMSLIGNILWLLCGGLISAFVWFFWGILWSITVVGIPLGIQCFKFAGLSLAPFGKEIVYNGGGISLLANIVWLVVTGVEMAIANVITGCILCITIIGIPFGKQFFKFAKLSLMPFGAEIRDSLF